MTKMVLTFNLYKFPSNSQILQACFPTTNFVQNLLPASKFLQIPFQLSNFTSLLPDHQLCTKFASSLQLLQIPLQLPNFTSLLPDYQRYTKFASSLQLYYREWGAGTAPQLHIFTALNLLSVRPLGERSRHQHCRGRPPPDLLALRCFAH